MSKNLEPQNPLFGNQKDLDQVLVQASAKISEINLINNNNNFRSVNHTALEDGASWIDLTKTS